MARRAEVGRDLKRQPAPGAEGLSPAGQQGLDDQAPTAARRWRRSRRPGRSGRQSAESARPKLSRGPLASSRLAAAIISAEESTPTDLGARPAAGQLGGQLARAAARGPRPARAARPDRAVELEERTRPLVAEAQVLPGIPHATSPFLLTSRYLPLSMRAEVSMSRDMLHGMAQADRDEVDDLVARGTRSGPTSTSRRCRCSAGCPGWPGTWTGPGGPRSPLTSLEPWEFDVLSALRRQGPPYQLSPGALLRATLVTSGTMTNRIDRLPRRAGQPGTRDPQDKRGVLVSSPSGANGSPTPRWPTCWTASDACCPASTPLSGTNSRRFAGAARAVRRPGRPRLTQRVKASSPADGRSLAVRRSCPSRFCPRGGRSGDRSTAAGC